MEEEVPPIPENAPLPTMITLYSRDLRYVTHLTRQERALYLKDFDPERKQDFTESCLWLPVRIVQGICTHQPKFWKHAMDFVQQGNLGLMDAIDHAPNQSPFESMIHFHRYAAVYIRGYIYEYYNHLPLIYISRISRRKSYAKDKEKYEEAFKTLQETISLETLLTEEEFDLPDLTGEGEQENKEKQDEIERLLSCLSTNERKVVILHYGLYGGIAYHFREIAEILSINFSSARRVHDYALKRMDGKLKSYVKERHTQERDERFVELLAEWQAKGVKITVKRFREEVRCDSKAANKFLREQGAIRPYRSIVPTVSHSLADPTSSPLTSHLATNEDDQEAPPIPLD